MRPFARPTPLQRLSLEARLIYTAFSLFMLLGYASSVWLYADDAMGLGPEGARTYYLGEKPAQPDGADSEASDGPELDLDGLMEDTAPDAHAGMRFEKPARQVVETFHFHLFSMSVCYVIIAHIFMMGSWSRRLRVGLIVVSGVATLVHVLAPVLIRFVSDAMAGLMGPSAVLLGLTWLIMTLQPVWEMWRLPLPSPKNN